MNRICEEFQIAVIGAGHAGIEAALAAARLGVKTVLFTLSLDGLANMPCNPSIGGTAKGHLVREIDALGGEMGKAADATFLQSRMLNLGKGPAVHSLRVQSDRRAYHHYMKRVIENQPNLCLKQGEIVDLQVENGRLTGVMTKLGMLYRVQAAIICSGTYQNAKIHIGEVNYASGPDNQLPSCGLTDRLPDYGITIRRFKTGTPSRVHRRSIDFSQLEEQKGDDPIVPFSFTTDPSGLKNKVSCYVAYTNETTHKIILDNLDRSPLYGEAKRIQGVGPRYCPSIEDKVVRFSDKKRHQLFIEPMGLDTQEMYLQGMSSSLPEDVQLAFLHSIHGLEKVEVMRNAYAIEYDCCDAQQLKATLEFKPLPGLYGAGQFNGTSGYEEAAAQGLVAGINAAMQVLGREPLVMDRSESYIGTLIDDITIKGVMDPYRMMTSRSEYRLLLRQDNADQRLTPIGYRIGLISEERYQKFLAKWDAIHQEIQRLEHTTLSPTQQLNEILVSRETSTVSTGVKLADLIRRPQVRYQDLASVDTDRPDLPRDVWEQAEIQLKYAGYIQKQLDQVKQMKKLENKRLPEGTDYKQITGLRLEAQEKLNKVQPYNLGQAGRISGVTPADVTVLLIWLEGQGKEEKSHAESQ